MGPYVAQHMRAHTRARQQMQTCALCIIVQALLLPVCDPPHLGSLATGGPTVWAGDELLMAATWHCHVAFSMTVASVSVRARLLYTPGAPVMNTGRKTAT